MRTTLLRFPTIPRLTCAAPPPMPLLVCNQHHDRKRDTRETVGQGPGYEHTAHVVQSAHMTKTRGRHAVLVFAKRELTANGPNRCAGEAQGSGWRAVDSRSARDRMADLCVPGGTGPETGVGFQSPRGGLARRKRRRRSGVITPVRRGNSAMEVKLPEKWSLARMRPTRIRFRGSC